MRYLLITYVRKPQGQIDEIVGFATKVRDKDYNNCNVIVDYKDKKVLKCVIEGKKVETNFQLMDDYYRKVYPELIKKINDEAEKFT